MTARRKAAGPREPGNGFYQDKRCFVSGGAGSIGSSLIIHLLERGAAVIRVLDNDENGLFRLRQRFTGRVPGALGGLDLGRVRYLLGDVRERERVLRAMSGIDLVFHLAALKHVELNEYSPFECVKTNVLGSQNLIEAALESGVERFLNISTDKAVEPASIYGECKKLSEALVTTAQLWKGDAETIFSNIRLPNVEGSRGSVMEIWEEERSHGRPLTVTDEGMRRYFVSIGQAASYILTACEAMEGGETFVPAGLKAVRVIDLARRLSPDIKLVGARRGEKLEEVMMTEREKEMAERRGDFWVIKPWLDQTNPSMPTMQQAV